ncbi:MAG: DegT/DnrJ/EryC1/StrS family aminotransferase [Caulobacteraceae bacterium]
MPVAWPSLPPADRLLRFIKRIDEARYYSNWGGLCLEFERRLQAQWRAPDGGVVALSSGTAALMDALSVTKKPGRSLCLMPSWTFVATAHAASRAGLEPYFLDVDAGSWALTPELARAAPPGVLEAAAAVVVVSPFGAPLDPGPWDLFAEETGVPVVIDAAAAFDTLAVGRAPTVVSLHATKAFGVGEGGAVVSRDADVIARIKSFANFGFVNGREALGPGDNVKLSEYAAAVGLASFEDWTQTRTALRERQAAYGDGLRALYPFWFQGRAAPHWASTTYVTALPRPAALVAEHLSSRGVATRQWWGEGCHRQRAFEGCGRTDLPNTEWLARNTIGLPMFVDMEPADIQRVLAEVSVFAQQDTEQPMCSPWPQGDRIEVDG